MKHILCMLLPIVIPYIFSSCTKAPDSQCCVSKAVEQRLDKTVIWNKECSVDEQVQSKINALLNQTLTVDSAIQIALLNNSRIQETFEEIGISQADLIAAGLFSNPIFDLVVRYPNKKQYKTDVEYSITGSFIDLFLIPLRTKVAEAELEKTMLKVTNDILDISFRVEQTYYELQAAQQELTYAQSIAEATSILTEIASRQKDIHNVNQFYSEQIQLELLEATLKIAKIQSTITHLRECLNKLLGLREDVAWVILNDFPEIDYTGLPLERLECVAFKERLDLQAARFEVIRLGNLLGLKQGWVYTNGRIGIGGEKDPNGLNTLGPVFSGEIPIFNFGQASRLRIEAELRQAKDRLVSLETQILSEVRESHKLLMNNLRILNSYRSEILPLQKKILESCEELYNVMWVGIDKLLEKKRQELQARSNFMLTQKDYWISRVRLDQALGGKLYLIFHHDDERLSNEKVEK